MRNRFAPLANADAGPGSPVTTGQTDLPRPPTWERLMKCHDEGHLAGQREREDPCAALPVSGDG